MQKRLNFKIEFYSLKTFFCFIGFNKNGIKCTQNFSCQNQPNLCHADAECLPSGKCKCKFSYFGDGQNCTKGQLKNNFLNFNLKNFITKI